MKTEELRETMRRPLIDFAKEYNDIWPSYGTYGQFLGRKGICEDKCIAQILKACKEAGLAFVKEDAELPENPIDKGYTDTVTSMRRYIYDQAQQDMLKAGYRKTEEIEQI